MDFINNILKMINNNILLNGIVLIIIFILTCILTPFLEPLGKKLSSLFFPPKINIKIDFSNIGFEYPSSYESNEGFFGIPTRKIIFENHYNYYITLTNNSEVALTDFILTLNHSIVIDKSEEKYFDKNNNVDHFKVGEKIKFKICPEYSLLKDEDINISITANEIKKEIKLNRILEKSLKRIKSIV